MPYGLGIDVGSTNVKVVLVASDGGLAAGAERPLVAHRDGDVAEQDAEALWEATVDAVREAASHAPDAAGDVCSVGVCSQYSSIVPVDEHARPTAPMMLWSDRRGTAPSFAIMERHPDALGTFLERHGIPPIGSGLSLGHVLHFQQERPDVHAATAAYLEPMDYVNARLTGRLAATQCTMFMVQVCDNRTTGATDYDDELLRLSGVDPDRLPPLLPVAGVVGEIRGDVAEELGVARGATVHAAMNDSHAGAFASGAFADGRGGVAIGTTAVLLDTVDHKDTDLEHELTAMPSPVPGRYLAWAENGIAGRAVEHVLGGILYASDVLGDHRTPDPFATLDDALAASEPGSGGVLFLPWLEGSLAPDADGRMRGGFLNVSLRTRRVDLVRASVEGTAHNLRWLLPALESFTGDRMDELVFYGGAARSSGWRQVLADVLDRTVLTVADPDRAVARAVALVALDRSGLAEHGADAPLVVDRAEPSPAHRECYGRMQEQFVAAFGALRPISAALNERV